MQRSQEQQDKLLEMGLILISQTPPVDVRRDVHDFVLFKCDAQMKVVSIML